MKKVRQKSDMKVVFIHAAVAVISIFLWMKSSSHVFADRLFMFFPWLGGRVLALLFHTLLRLYGFLFWLFLTIFRNRQALPALHAERSGAICKIGAAQMCIRDRPM